MIKDSSLFGLGTSPGGPTQRPINGYAPFGQLDYQSQETLRVTRFSGSSPYMKTLIQSRIIDSNEITPNASPNYRVMSPTSSVNTSALHPQVVRVTENETSYA